MVTKRQIKKLMKQLQPKEEVNIEVWLDDDEIADLHGEKVLSRQEYDDYIARKKAESEENGEELIHIEVTAPKERREYQKKS